MNLKNKHKLTKEQMAKYRTARNEVVRFLREDLGLTFNEIGKEFTKTRQWASHFYKQAKKDSPNKHPFAWPDMKEDLK